MYWIDSIINGNNSFLFLFIVISEKIWVNKIGWKKCILILIITHIRNFVNVFIHAYNLLSKLVCQTPLTKSNITGNNDNKNNDMINDPILFFRSEGINSKFMFEVRFNVNLFYFNLILITFIFTRLRNLKNYIFETNIFIFLNILS